MLMSVRSTKAACSSSCFTTRSAAVPAGARRVRSVAAGATAAGGSDSGLSWKAEDLEALLDGRIDKCDLVESFSRAANKQQGRPREDVHSYLEPPPAAHTKSKAAAAAQPRFPAWCELMQSLDSTDVIDWSDVENDGWGVATAEQSSGSNGGWSSSSSSSSTAAAVAGGRRCMGALWSGAAFSSSRRQGLIWGGMRLTQRAAVAVRAAPSSKQVETESDDAPHYEGADSDTLFPAGSLEMDDPGHPTDIMGAKDTQAAVVRPEAKPYMNIKNGRWVPPSKSQAEAMMGQLSQMGPDEGI